MRTSRLLQQRGVTLVETLISIVILSVSFSAIASLLSGSVLNSANPMIREQAVSLAESYLEMVLLQAYTDPDGGDTGTCEEGNDSNRALYDDVNDFDCILDDNGARDQVGTLIPGLGGYNIAIDLQAATLNGAAATRIDVTVTHDALTSLSILLTGYRINYP